jgi:hypothetical protein
MLPINTLFGNVVNPKSKGLRPVTMARGDPQIVSHTHITTALSANALFLAANQGQIAGYSCSKTYRNKAEYFVISTFCFQPLEANWPPIPKSPKMVRKKFFAFKRAK